MQLLGDTARLWAHPKHNGHPRALTKQQTLPKLLDIAVYQMGFSHDQAASRAADSSLLYAPSMTGSVGIMPRSHSTRWAHPKPENTTALTPCPGNVLSPTQYRPCAMQAKWVKPHMCQCTSCKVRYVEPMCHFSVVHIYWPQHQQQPVRPSACQPVTPSVRPSSGHHTASILLLFAEPHLDGSAVHGHAQHAKRAARGDGAIGPIGAAQEAPVCARCARLPA